MGLQNIFSSLFGPTGDPPEPAAETCGAYQPPSIWHRIALKYDVCWMPAADLQAIGELLYSAGAIGRPDLLLFVLHPDTGMPDWLGLRPQRAAGRGAERNWINALEAKRTHCRESYGVSANYERMLALLRRIDAARAEVPPQLVQRKVHAVAA